MITDLSNWYKDQLIHLSDFKCQQTPMSNLFEPKIIFLKFFINIQFLIAAVIFKFAQYKYFSDTF